MKGLPGMLALCLLAWDAHADLSGMDPAKDPMVFKRLDSDQNGRISRVEARPMLPMAQHFDGADRDGDGQLDPAELASALTPARGD